MRFFVPFFYLGVNLFYIYGKRCLTNFKTQCYAGSGTFDYVLTMIYGERCRAGDRLSPGTAGRGDTESQHPHEYATSKQIDNDSLCCIDRLDVFVSPHVTPTDVDRRPANVPPSSSAVSLPPSLPKVMGSLLLFKRSSTFGKPFLKIYMII